MKLRWKPKRSWQGVSRSPNCGPPGSLNASLGLSEPQKSTAAFSSVVPASVSRSSPSGGMPALHVLTAFVRHAGSLAFACTHEKIAPTHLRYVFDEPARYLPTSLFMIAWHFAACTVCIGRFTG